MPLTLWFSKTLLQALLAACFRSDLEGEVLHFTAPCRRGTRRSSLSDMKSESRCSLPRRNAETAQSVKRLLGLLVFFPELVQVRGEWHETFPKSDLRKTNVF